MAFLAFSYDSVFISFIVFIMCGFSDSSSYILDIESLFSELFSLGLPDTTFWLFLQFLAES